MTTHDANPDTMLQDDMKDGEVSEDNATPLPDPPEVTP